MSELTCDVVFYKSIEYGYINCTNVNEGEALGSYVSHDSVEVGRTTVTVEIKDDIRKEQIEALEEKITMTQAECERNIGIIRGQIQSLQAIEHTPEAV